MYADISEGKGRAANRHARRRNCTRAAGVTIELNATGRIGVE